MLRTNFPCILNKLKRKSLLGVHCGCLQVVCRCYSQKWRNLMLLWDGMYQVDRPHPERYFSGSNLLAPVTIYIRKKTNLSGFDKAWNEPCMPPAIELKSTSKNLLKDILEIFPLFTASTGTQHRLVSVNIWSQPRGTLIEFSNVVSTFFHTFIQVLRFLKHAVPPVKSNHDVVGPNIWCTQVLHALKYRNCILPSPCILASTNKASICYDIRLSGRQVSCFLHLHTRWYSVQLSYLLCQRYNNFHTLLIWHTCRFVANRVIL